MSDKAPITPQEMRYLTKHDVPEMVDAIVTFLNSEMPGKPTKALIGFLCYCRGYKTPRGIPVYKPPAYEGPAVGTDTPSPVSAQDYRTSRSNSPTSSSPSPSNKSHSPGSSTTPTAKKKNSKSKKKRRRRRKKKKMVAEGGNSPTNAQRVKNDKAGHGVHGIHASHSDTTDTRYMKTHDVPEMIDTMVTYLNTIQPQDPSKALIAFLCHFKGIPTPKEIPPYEKLDKPNGTFSGQNGGGISSAMSEEARIQSLISKIEAKEKAEKEIHDIESKMKKEIREMEAKIKVLEGQKCRAKVEMQLDGESKHDVGVIENQICEIEKMIEMGKQISEVKTIQLNKIIESSLLTQQETTEVRIARTKVTGGDNKSKTRRDSPPPRRQSTSSTKPRQTGSRRSSTIAQPQPSSRKSSLVTGNKTTPNDQSFAPAENTVAAVAHEKLTSLERVSKEYTESKTKHNKLLKEIDSEIKTLEGKRSRSIVELKLEGSSRDDPDELKSMIIILEEKKQLLQDKFDKLTEEHKTESDILQLSSSELEAHRVWKACKGTPPRKAMVQTSDNNAKLRNAATVTQGAIRMSKEVKIKELHKKKEERDRIVISNQEIIKSLDQRQHKADNVLQNLTKEDTDSQQKYEKEQEFQLTALRQVETERSQQLKTFKETMQRLALTSDEETLLRISDNKLSSVGSQEGSKRNQSNSSLVSLQKDVYKKPLDSIDRKQPTEPDSTTCPELTQKRKPSLEKRSGRQLEDNPVDRKSPRRRESQRSVLPSLHPQRRASAVRQA